MFIGCKEIQGRTANREKRECRLNWNQAVKEREIERKEGEKKRERERKETCQVGDKKGIFVIHGNPDFRWSILALLLPLAYMHRSVSFSYYYSFMSRSSILARRLYTVHKIECAHYTLQRQTHCLSSLSSSSSLSKWRPFKWHSCNSGGTIVPSIMYMKWDG